MITIHPQLEKDCILLGQFPLSALLLLNDASYPWFILLPGRDGITEIHHLTSEDQQQLLRESMHLSRCLEQTFQPDKLNIAALGNIVPQLHVHHIARYNTDACWPAPVWGAGSPVPYHLEQINDIKNQVFNWLDTNNHIRFLRAGRD